MTTPKNEEKLEYDKPDVDDTQKELIQSLQTMFGGGNINALLEEKTRYTVALELFKLGRKYEQLQLISELDKEHVEILTRHDTLVYSAKLLFHLEDNEVTELVNSMGRSYQIHQIAKDRKSRKEIVQILASAIENIRTIPDKLMGRRL